MPYVNNDSDVKDIVIKISKTSSILQSSVDAYVRKAANEENEIKSKNYTYKANSLEEFMDRIQGAIRDLSVSMQIDFNKLIEKESK